MCFKGLKSLCFRYCGAGHVSNYAQHPCFFYPTCYTRISFILARNWKCKDSLEISFNGECAHGLR